MSKIVPYNIIRAKRKSIGLQITSDGKVIVCAPRFVPTFYIDKFVDEKSHWIEKKLSEIQKRPKSLKRQFTDGEKILFLGKEYVLQITDRIEIEIHEDMVLFPKALLFRAEKELENWYIQQAKEKISQRVIYHSQKMKADYKDIFFSNTSSKWGTCFPDNSLQFNWRLIMAPVMVIDYVVIHELVHTTEKNHKSAFWRKVSLYTPAFKQHRKWLTTNGHILVI